LLPSLIYAIIPPLMEPKPQNEKFYNSIPDLVRNIAEGSASYSRRAHEQLIQATNADPSFNPVILVTAEFQRYLQKASLAKEGALLMALAGYYSATEEHRQEQTAQVIHITPQVRKAAENIHKQNEAMRTVKPAAFKTLTANWTYTSTIDAVVSVLSDPMRPALTFNYYPRPTLEEKDQFVAEGEAIRAWYKKIKEVQYSQEKHIPTQRDELIDLLKNQPDKSTQEENLFTIKHEGSSLADIENLPFPLTPEAYRQMSRYLAYALEHTGSTDARRTIEHLFFDPIDFYDQTQRKQVPHTQRDLLITLAAWQNQFHHDVLIENSDPETEATTRDILNFMSAEGATALLWSIDDATMYPARRDPFLPAGSDTDSMDTYALANFARSWLMDI
jgi:hypothetical protein